MRTRTSQHSPGLSRRSFCRAGGAFSLLALSHPLVRGLDRLVDDHHLLIIQLKGGNDGFNTVIPVADDCYHRLRPSLAIKPTQALRVADGTGLHPALAPLADLYHQGLVAIHQGAGFPEANRTHAQGNALWDALLPRLAGNLAERPQIARFTADAPALGNRLISLLPQIRDGRNHAVRVVEVDGFDTHLHQARAHAFLLEAVATGVATFQRAIQREGAAQRTTLLIYSELGRSLAENAFGGTDHGTVGPVLLVGSGVEPGMHGSLPALQAEVAAHLPCTLDVRQFAPRIVPGLA